MMSEEMTLRTVDDVVHLVHATEVSTMTMVCGLKTSYLDHELSDSWNDPPTCFRCITEPFLWHRPPYEPGDKRYKERKP